MGVLYVYDHDGVFPASVVPVAMLHDHALRTDYCVATTVHNALAISISAIQTQLWTNPILRGTRQPGGYMCWWDPVQCSPHNLAWWGICPTCGPIVAPSVSTDDSVVLPTNWEFLETVEVRRLVIRDVVRRMRACCEAVEAAGLQGLAPIPVV